MEVYVPDGSICHVGVYVADAFVVGHLVDVPAPSAEIEKAFGSNISQQPCQKSKTENTNQKCALYVKSTMCLEIRTRVDDTFKQTFDTY